MEINGFHEIRDFRDGAHLRHSCRAVKSAGNIFSQKNIIFSCETKTCHTSFLTLWRVWEHLGTTQNHQNPWFSYIYSKNMTFHWFCTRIKKKWLCTCSIHLKLHRDRESCVPGPRAPKAREKNGVPRDGLIKTPAVCATEFITGGLIS